MTTPPALALDAVAKSFGAVRALAGVSFQVGRGERVGLIGHNGAGKSTLMHVLSGSLKPDEGRVAADGKPIAPYDSTVARGLGLRSVYQELALCPNLSVAENTRVLHPALTGWGWRRRAADLIREQLDLIFPGHGIDPATPVGDLAIGRRQMVEIARAFTVTDLPVRLVILDEPTSSLDAGAAEQLLAHLARAAAQGVAAVFISHILGEVLAAADRIVVMREGLVALEAPAAGLTKRELVEAMEGGSESHGDAAPAPRGDRPRAEACVTVAAERGGLGMSAAPGEVIGLAGLAAHGQTAMLRRIFAAATSRDPVIKVGGPVALVAGDRQADGVFPLWSIERNITVGSLPDLKRGGLIDPARERAMAEDWRGRIGIRTRDVGNPILSLSGGNQQKALFARALGSAARIVLMDDPMRGVDVGTKHEVYRLIRAEADAGRCFLWYSTELEELFHCDRVLVFRAGRIVASFERHELSERAIIAASHGEVAA